MSKLNVGVGAEFPVDAAEPGDDARYEGCDYAYFRHRHRRFGRHGGRFFFIGPFALVVFIALISMAVSYPMVILGLVAIAAVAFMARHHRHDWYDDDDDRRRYDPRDRTDYRGRGRGYDPRDRADLGPQPDAPDNAAPGRS